MCESGKAGAAFTLGEGHRVGQKITTNTKPLITETTIFIITTSPLLNERLRVTSRKAGSVFIWCLYLLADVTFLLVLIHFDTLVGEVNRKSGVSGQNPGFPRHSVPLYFNFDRVHRCRGRG